MRRTFYGVDLLLFIIALLTIAVVANYFAHRPEARWTFDATKTRAYSLSAQSRELLAELDGRWTIALVMARDDEDSAAIRQVDEVLRRYAQETDAISVIQIDPTDPASLGKYEALLAQLRSNEAETIEAYEKALDRAVVAFRDLQLFAQRQASQLQRALSLLEPDDAARTRIQQRLGLLGLLADEGDQVLEVVAEARRTNEAQPIPDYETARSILAQALAQWADELYAMAEIYRGWRTDPEASAVLTRFAANVMPEYEELAGRLAGAADPLARLPELELASVGRQLQSGELAVIIGPPGAAVVPSEQLFPKLNVRTLGEGQVAFDRRFRGEQVISAAIRSLRVEHMPLVVFVHTGPRSLFRQSAEHADVVGVASTLRAQRFDVREWNVVEGDVPVAEDGQPTVWVIVPPAQRESLEPDENERALIRMTERLISDGEPVLLSVYPSLLPRYRQSDPWQMVAGPLGLQPDTGNVVFEAAPAGGGDLVYQTWQMIEVYSADHPICRAVNGQRTQFEWPVPITVREDTPSEVRYSVLASVMPGANRWLEDDWLNKQRSMETVERGEPFAQPGALAIAAERPHPVESGTQRAIVVGSGSWMLSRIADAASSIGGGRAVLRYPGNQEFMLASTAWLAGMDELIAPSPVSQQVARLDEIDDQATATWALIAIVGAPFVCLLLGVVVWLVRRI
jgi:hypothetical protein